MTAFFLLICSISVLFFILFLIACCLPERKQRRSIVRKMPEAQAIDSLGGRRIFAHLEEQMAEFFSSHRHPAAILLLAVLLIPGRITAQTTAGSDQSIPPAVAQQLEAMQKRIDQLEQQLNARNTASPTADGPRHDVSDQGSGPASPQSMASPESATQAKKPAQPEPFSFADFSWLNGNSRVKDVPFQNAFFTPEIRADVDYVYDFNHPSDDTIGGSSEIFRANEFQVTQLGVGGDFHFDNVQARLMTQFGMYSQTTPRNDASPARGQWNLADAYRYISEAYGGYHINALDGINVQAGIFMSYIGLFSYYNFDNWAYQPSYVSSNTPWFFNGMRVQIYTSPHLKIEPWLLNGWQSYGRFNGRMGVGGQILWRPNGWFSFVGNQYALGEDTLGVPGRVRYHTDDSIQVKYYDHPDRTLDKMAFTFTGDMGCEHGGGVSCTGDSKQGPKQSFIGYMVYNRFWFHKDLYAVTVGGG